ncbi:hypothetical protein PENTCL1PPCAC_20597, partial [Pristionchus entomophagus]
GCPTLVSISMPQAACIEEPRSDCNPLPEGSTTTSFVCPDGTLAWKEKSSGQWHITDIKEATCNEAERTWNIKDVSEDRIYACLSDNDVCDFTATACPQNFLCVGSTPTEIASKPKKLGCTNHQLFAKNANDPLMIQPQTCEKGKWKDSGNRHLDVFCGYLI